MVEEGRNQLSEQFTRLRGTHLDRASQLLGSAAAQVSEDTENALVLANSAVDLLRRVLVLDSALEGFDIDALTPDDLSHLTRILPHTPLASRTVTRQQTIQIPQTQVRQDLELDFPNQAHLTQNAYDLLSPDRSRLIYSTREALRDRTYSYVGNRHPDAEGYLGTVEPIFLNDLQDVERKMREGAMLQPNERPNRLGMLFRNLDQRFPFSSMSLDENIGVMYRRREAIVVMEARIAGRPSRYFVVSGRAEMTEEDAISPRLASGTVAGNRNGHVDEERLDGGLRVIATADHSNELGEPGAALASLQPAGEGGLALEGTELEEGVGETEASPDHVDTPEVGSNQVAQERRHIPRSREIKLLLTDDEILESSPDDLEISDAVAFIVANLLLAQKGFDDLPQIVERMTEQDWKMLKRGKDALNHVAETIIANPELARPTHARLKFITLDPEGARRANRREFGQFLVRRFEGADDYTLRRLLHDGINIKS